MYIKRMSSKVGFIKYPAVFFVLLCTTLTGSTFLIGCAPMQTGVALTVTVPQLPCPLRDEARVDFFLISYFSAEGMECTYRYKPEIENVELYCTKQNNMPVTARPVIRCGEKGEKEVELLSAGGIFPLDAEIHGDKVVLGLSWKHGIAADIFKELYRQNVPIEKFNLKRFYYELDSLDINDPWLLDKDYIMQKIAGGLFRVTYLKEKPAFPVSVPLTNGRWIFNNPFSQIYKPDSESGILKLNATPGFYTLIELEDLKTVDIYVGKTGDYEYISGSL